MNLMKSYFSAEFFKGNRQRLRRLFTGTAPIILTANGLMQRSGDSAFAFRQDSNFWYLTGITDPDVMLVMDKEREYLIVPGRDARQQTFEGAIDMGELTERSGIEVVLDEENGWKKLKPRLNRVRHVATLAAPAAYIPTHNLYTNPARSRLITRLKEENSQLELLDLRQHLSVMRMIKQKPELQAMRAAIAMTETALGKVMRRVNAYEYEYQIEADITRLFRSRGALGHAYDPIVAGGANACTLHYGANAAMLNAGDLVVIDVGAEVEHYSADLTRTYSLGKPSKRQQAVYAAVLEVQEYAINQLKPGVLVKEYEATIEYFMGEKLRELGLIKIIEHDEVRRYYPHSTSHFLGLDTHDAGDYERPLEPGMVLTVEPGIYMPDERIGVRIEDDVLITKQGARILSKRLPRSLI